MLFRKGMVELLCFWRLRPLFMHFFAKLVSTSGFYDEMSFNVICSSLLSMYELSELSLCRDQNARIPAIS